MSKGMQIYIHAFKRRAEQCLYKLWGILSHNFDSPLIVKVGCSKSNESSMEEPNDSRA